MKHEICNDQEEAPKELKGFKGHTYLEPGFVFAPYVPIQVQTINASTHRKLRKAGLKLGFLPRKPMATSYKKKKVLSDFYSQIKTTR
jgi:hypothetical protein